MLIGQILTPIIYFLFFGVAFSSNLRSFSFHGYQLDYLTFLLPGIIIMQTFATFNLTASMVSNERRYGIFRLLMVSNGSAGDYIGGKIVVETIIVLLQTLALILIATMVSPSIASIVKFRTIPYISLIVIISTIFWCNLGVILGLLLYKEEKRTMIVSILNLPILFCSSVFYDIDKIPGWMNKIATINPLTYCASSLRDAILTGSLVGFEFCVLLLLTILVGILTQLITSKISLVPGT